MNSGIFIVNCVSDPGPDKVPILRGFMDPFSNIFYFLQIISWVWIRVRIQEKGWMWNTDFQSWQLYVLYVPVAETKFLMHDIR
jgi:hypothetical protein